MAEVKIGDIADVKGGKRLPKGISLISEKNSHPYIRIRDLGDSKILELNDAYEYVDDETQKKISKYTVESGDVLISIVGTIGLVAIVGDSLNGANLTENCVKLINLKGVERDYLYYFLKSTIGQEEIHKGTVGAVQPKLPIKNIQAIPISLPDLQTQKRIVKMLAPVDSKIDINKAINTNLEHQLQRIFKEWFIDNPETHTWKRAEIGELIESTLGGDWGKEENTGNYTEMVYCMRGADIPEVRAGNKGKMPTRFIIPKNYKSKHLVAGDIVVEISGGSPTQSTGRVAAISQSLLDRYDQGMVCTNFCRALKPKEGFSMFVYYYWQYLYDRNVFFSYENGTIGIKNLDLNSILENEWVFVPPTNKLNEFNKLCFTVFDMIFANGLEIEELGKCRDKIITKLMLGEIDVTNI